MSADKKRVFRFNIEPRHTSFAMGHCSGSVSLSLVTEKISLSLDHLSAFEARAMANALYEAADFAERALPVVPALPVCPSDEVADAVAEAAAQITILRRPQ